MNMSKYRVIVTEVFQKAVAVEAPSKADAYQRVLDAWRNTEFILEPEDCFIKSDIYVAGPANGTESEEVVSADKI